MKGTIARVPAPAARIVVTFRPLLMANVPIFVTLLLVITTLTRIGLWLTLLNAPKRLAV